MLSRACPQTKESGLESSNSRLVLPKKFGVQKPSNENFEDRHSAENRVFLQRSNKNPIVKWIFLTIFPCIISSTVNSQNIQDSILHDGIFRTYELYLPPSYSPAHSHALVFVLHGGGGNATYMSAYTQFNKAADTARFIVVYPEGIFTGINAGGQPGHAWADGREVLLPDSLGIDDVGFFDKLIDSLLLKYAIDETCIFATGISNGGIMCQRLASELSYRIAAVASVSASFPDSLVADFNPTEPISVMFINGTNDRITPVISGGVGLSGGSNISTDSAISLWLMNNQCVPIIDSVDLPNTALFDFTTVTKFSYSGCRDFTEIVFMKINNGGHTWPQENDTLHVPLTGLSCQDINGTGEIWTFFKTHCKSTGTRTEEFIDQKQLLEVYPNPSDNQFTLQFHHFTGNSTIRIYDIHGKLLFVKNINLTETDNFSLNIQNKGIYILEAEYGAAVLTKKLINY